MGTTWLKRQTLTSWRHAAFDIRFIGITFFELIDSSLLKHGQNTDKTRTIMGVHALSSCLTH